MVGTVGVGGKNPIRIQSMTNTDTMDTEGTVDQIIRLVVAGCEIIRVTAPAKKDAENLGNIRKQLKAKGYPDVALVADIHFSPQAAMIAADFVDKVRINPGNYTDKKKFLTRDYSEAEFRLEVEKAEEAFFPLLQKCQENGRAIRIGTNHGSLSDRIMNRYGDTPQGMVESALEFIEFAERQSFYNIIVSMKASNPKVMIQAYRLLASRFLSSGRNYPLHLGVTEAGDGEDGRIRSAVGIGSLLEDGLGDTIRVSLTEDPEKEIPVAQRLVAKYNHPFPLLPEDNYSEFRDPFHYNRLYSKEVALKHISLGEEHPPRVEVSMQPESAKEWLADIKTLLQKTKNSEARPEIFHVNCNSIAFIRDLSAILLNEKPDYDLSLELDLEPQRMQEINGLALPDKIVLNPFRYALDTLLLFSAKFLELKIHPADFPDLGKLLYFLKENRIENVGFSLAGGKIVTDYRKLLFHLQYEQFPVVLCATFSSAEQALYDASVAFGSLLSDGIGDCLRVECAAMDSQKLLNFSYDLLQVCVLRKTKTEFISCPSCGRTLFNIQETLARIKKRTGHLKGVKIAVMGCIVNGPGEMADADYGYVGAGPGKIHLYKNHEIVIKSVPDVQAEEKLVELIRSDGKWVDP